MDAEEYHKAAEVVEGPIANIVKSQMESLDILVKDLAPQLSKSMGYSGVSSSTNTFIGYTKAGYGHGYLPYVGQCNKLHAEVKGLQRLSILLYALKVDENNPIIGKIKKYYDSFEYPPPEEKRVELLLKTRTQQ